MVQGRSSSRSSAGSGAAARNSRETSVAARVESIIGCKWSVVKLMRLVEGCRRPSDMLRACPGLSAKVMNERWRKFIRFGLVRRVVHGEKPPVEVEYHLTPFGRRFMKIVDEVRLLQEDVDRKSLEKVDDSTEMANKTAQRD